MTEERKCSSCGNVLPINEFQFQNKRKNKRKYKCKKCTAIITKLNSEKKKSYDAKNYIKHRDTICKNTNNYKRQNREEVNKREKIRKRRNEENNPTEYKAKRKLKKKRENERRRKNPILKMRHLVSGSIRDMIKSLGGTKKSSFLSVFGADYPKKLIAHIENQFIGENSWMNWSNHGVYNPKTWEDNDSSTWTWQLDHIIPHSNFHYTSPTDEQCLKAWDLSNLRPYPAKHNVSEGNRR